MNRVVLIRQENIGAGSGQCNYLSVWVPGFKVLNRPLCEGFAYSEAKEGLWTEGTAQVALFMNLSGREEEADRLMKAVEAMRTSDGSYFAASARELPTGFMLETDPTQPRQYFHIAHLAALSWVAIAQRRYNPFTGTNALP